MAAGGIAFQPVAYKTVKAVEPLAHVRCTQGHVDPRGGSKPEHRLRPVQYSQQSLQCPHIESTANFDPAPASRLNHKRPVSVGISVRFRCPRRDHFNSNHRPGHRSRRAMNSSTVFIQCADSKASLSAELLAHQSTRFELRHQSRSCSAAAPPAHRSHFAHNSSASLNDAPRQSGLV